jgi:transposase
MPENNQIPQCKLTHWGISYYVIKVLPLTNKKGYLLLITSTQWYLNTTKRKKGSLMRKMQEFILKNKEIFVGLEDSKNSWKVCVRSENMERHITAMPALYPGLRGYFRNNYPECTIHVLYEAGFKGFGLHDQLAADGIDCVVIPPHLVTEAKVNKVKTDKRDARRLAKILESGDASACAVPDQERREDRQISRTLNGVKKEIKATRNRIHKLLAFHQPSWWREFADKETWNRKDFLALREQPLSAPLKIALNALLELLEKMWEIDVRLRSELRKLQKKDRYKTAFEIIHSIPGIGQFTAIRLILEWGEDVSRFCSGRHLASFTGLTCQEFSTGESIRRGSITHLGSSLVRTMFIECAWKAIPKDPVLGNKFKRVWRNSGSKTKAIVAVARMMVVRAHYCLTHKCEYQIGVVA